MAAALILLLLASLLPSSLPAVSAAAPSGEDLLSELETLRSRSPTGVIRLTDALVARYITGARAPRPYTFLIFFDAVQLHSKPELHLPRLRSEFALLAPAFLQSAPSLFFAEIEFGESQQSFAQFDVQSLPHGRLLRPEHTSPKEAEQMSPAEFSGQAESMAEFVASRLNVGVPQIERPPPLSKQQMVVLGALLVILLPFLVKRIIDGDTMLHDPKVWAAGAVFVYFFSVSGAMYGVIRGAPLFTRDRADPSKMVYFYQGSGMQFGAEGFAVGSLYTAVGLMVAFVTHLLVKIQNVQIQRGCMLVVMGVSYWAVRKVIVLDNWKTGYGIHTFFPKSWR